MSVYRNILMSVAVLIVIFQARSVSSIACTNVTINVQDQVHFYLYTHPNGEMPEEIILDDTASLTASTFNPNLPIRFLIHDWREDGSSDVNKKLMRGFLDNGFYNIIVVDWGKIAQDRTYVIASTLVNDVGFLVGRFLEFLKDVQFSQSSVYLLGFGLGAHVCGFAGKYKESQVDVIIGMDPAGTFELFTQECRLSLTDADYVLIVHTAVNTIGIKANIGHCDFYINFGVAIPGDSIASHRASYIIIAKSFYSENQYWGKNCGNYYQVVTDFRQCSGTGPQAKLGGIPINISIRGIYNVEVDPNTLR